MFIFWSIKKNEVELYVLKEAFYVREKQVADV